MQPQTEAQEIQLMTEALAAARQMQAAIKADIRAGKKVANFMELRQLQLDVETLEAEIRRSA